MMMWLVLIPMINMWEVVFSCPSGVRCWAEMSPDKSSSLMVLRRARPAPTQLWIQGHIKLNSLMETMPSILQL
jgi:hypothetical protein